MMEIDGNVTPHHQTIAEEFNNFTFLLLTTLLIIIL